MTAPNARVTVRIGLVEVERDGKLTNRLTAFVWQGTTSELELGGFARALGMAIDRSPAGPELPDPATLTVPARRLVRRLVAAYPVRAVHADGRWWPMIPLIAAAAPALATFDPVIRIPRRVVLATLRRGREVRRIYLITRDRKHGKALPLSLALGVGLSALALRSQLRDRAPLAAIGDGLLAHHAMSTGAGLAAQSRAMLESLTDKERAIVELRLAAAPPPASRFRRELELDPKLGAHTLRAMRWNGGAR